MRKAIAARMKKTYVSTTAGCRHGLFGLREIKVRGVSILL